MPIVKISTKNFVKGLRPSKRAKRNSGYLIEAEGAVGRDGVLQSLDELTRIATTEITDGFPYPQIRVFTNIIIVFGLTKIYEWVSSALVEKIEVAGGDPWSAMDMHDYVFMSNSVVTVVRSAMDKTYSETSDLPLASAICNFNGQIIVGAPDVTGG